MRLEHWLYALPLRWRSIVRRRQVDQDLDDEIQYHLEQQVDERVAAGMSRDDAWRVVVRDFGGVDLAKDRCRDERRVDLIVSGVQDVRYALRTLFRSPAYTAVAVLTLALGSGVNTAVFSLVDGILLARLPYPAPERLVSVTGSYPNGAFDAMRAEVRSLDAGVYAEGTSFTLTGAGEPLRVSGTRVSAELFSILGVKPSLGRWLRAGEDAAPRDRTVILSHAIWTSRFNQDPGILGRFIELDGVAREVVAVMPASFRFPSPRTDVWVPLGLDPANTTRYWAGDFMPAIGRLRPGAEAAHAAAEAQVFQSRIRTRFPWRMPEDWNKDVAVIPLQDALVGGVRTRLLILIAAVALVLVIACANVANLSLSRALARQREIAIRSAIGAGPGRIARQLLTESVVLSSLGALAGLLLASQVLSVLKLVLPADTPRLDEVHMNWRVLAFTASLAVLTGCAFGLAPVLQALRIRLRATLESGGRSGGRSIARSFRTALAVAQIACAVTLVIAAGLVVRSMWSLAHADLGFRSDRVVTARVSPTDSACGTRERCLAFYRALDTRVHALGGVTGAAFVNTLPLTGAIAKRSLEIDGYVAPATAAAPLFWMNVITPDYFRVMDIRLESGRAFTPTDLAGRPPVAIVTASAARRFWKDQNPLGRHLRFVGEDHWHTIVGVVADVRAYDPGRSVPAWIAGTIYVPHGPNATMEDGRVGTEMTLAMQTALPADQLTPALHRAVRDLDAEVVVDDVRAMREVFAQAVAAPAATTSLLVTMAALALVLGCTGVYGVLSFLVSRQTRDLGIRVALGAQRSDVFWLVIREGAVLSIAGIAFGVAGALACTRWLASELHGISPTDPATYVAVAVVVSVVTLTACYVPTRRAMGVDPLVVLRDQ